MSDERLKAFCKGLEMQNIPELITRTAGELRLLGQAMAKRIKGLAKRVAAKDAEIKRLRELVKAAYVEGWSDGLGEPDTYKQPEEGWWEDSVVYKHLANHEQQGKGNE